MMAERQRLETPQPTPQPPPQPQFQQPHAQVDDDALRRELHAEQARIYEYAPRDPLARAAALRRPRDGGLPLPGRRAAAGGGRRRR